MAARPAWEGHLRLSLVTCPVSLFRATGEGETVHFNLLHRETLHRVRQFYRDPDTGDEVTRAEMVRGFEVEPDHFVVVEDDELQALKLESTRLIDIERFVPAEEIDRLYWDTPYYMVPDGKTALEPFAVIRAAMEKAGRVALGRVVMHNRERLVGIEVRGRGLLASTLRAADEVVEEASYFDDIPATKVNAKMVEIAQRIIEQAEGAFDPSGFKDRYAHAVRELVEAKAAGKKPAKPKAAKPDSNVVDLMEALRRSLQGNKGGDQGGGKAKQAAPARKAAPGRATKAKPAPRRKAG